MKKVLVVAALLCGGACVELGDDPLYEAEFEGGGGSGGGDASFAAVQEIFSMRCTTSGCHGENATSANLLLVEGAAYEELLGPDGQGGVPTEHPKCQGVPMVEPGAPDDSCLWIRVENGDMPPGGLPQPMRQTIRAWIAAGALPE